MYKIWNTLHSFAVVGTVVVLVTFVMSPFAGCDSDYNNDIHSYSPPLASVNKTLHSPSSIDSVRLHAFDKMYFGDKSSDYKRVHYIDKMKYTVSCTKELPDGRVYSLLLVGDTKIKGLENAKAVLEGIKNIVSTKYANYSIKNQYHFIKDPVERERSQACFSLKDKLKYSKDHIGNCYEYTGYVWNLDYKHIQLGYFVNQAANGSDDNTYTAYIEITNNMLEKQLPENENPDLRRKMEASKF